MLKKRILPVPSSDISEADKPIIYKKPLRRSPSRKERPGKVRRLSKDQIIREYGMKAVGKLPNKEQVLWALKEQTTTDPESALSVREAIEKAGLKFTPSSHRNAMEYVWKTFGTDKGGMGLFERVKKGPGYLYYKATPKVDDYTLEELKAPNALKTKKVRKPATEAASDVAPAASPAPGTLNVNLKVTWDINLNLNGLKDLFK